MHFNDLHLFVDDVALQVSQLYKVLHAFIGIWLKYYGMLKH